MVVFFWIRSKQKDEINVHTGSYQFVRFFFLNIYHLFPKILKWEYYNVHFILMKDSTYASLPAMLVNN